MVGVTVRHEKALGLRRRAKQRNGVFSTVDKQRHAERLQAPCSSGVPRLAAFGGNCMLKKAALVALGLVALVLLAAKLLLPSYVTSPRQARERIIQQDLLTMRAVIGQYHLTSKSDRTLWTTLLWLDTSGTCQQTRQPDEKTHGLSNAPETSGHPES